MKSDKYIIPVNKDSLLSCQQTCQDICLCLPNQIPKLVDIRRADVCDIRKEIRHIAFGVRVLFFHVIWRQNVVDLSQYTWLVVVDVTDTDMITLLRSDGAEVDFGEVDRTYG